MFKKFVVFNKTDGEWEVILNLDEVASFEKVQTESLDLAERLKRDKDDGPPVEKFTLITLRNGKTFNTKTELEEIGPSIYWLP